MKRLPVNSSALASIGYDPVEKILELEFRDHGGVWQYYSFPPATFKKFARADSLGRFFVKKIKGKYREQKINE
jgi:hypothetical protein